MTLEEIESKIINARRKDGAYPYEFIKEMNKRGVWFAFYKDGVRWGRKPF